MITINAHDLRRSYARICKQRRINTQDALEIARLPGMIYSDFALPEVFVEAPANLYIYPKGITE